MAEIPVGPKLGWEGSIWISQKERASLDDARQRASLIKSARSNKAAMFAKYGLSKTARPYVVKAKGLPPEFADWEGALVDLHFELLGDVADEFEDSWNNGVAVALKKGGKWFALRSTGGKFTYEGTGNLHAMPIDEAQAGKMLQLPKDWDGKIETEKE
jgi:hypothetical protein